MIPYVEVAPVRLPGGAVVEPYGALVTAGIVSATVFCAAHAPRHGIPRGVALRALWWTVACGLLAAHLGDLVLYRPQELAHDPAAALLGFGSGLSAIAGIAGGATALLLFARSTGGSRLASVDLIVECAVVGWIPGRLGCSLVHDHPGAPSSFALAVAFPDGPRHDLGLYELAFTVLVLAPALVALDRLGARPGRRAAVVALLYGAARFALDFLRASDLPGSDPRYAGLTPAQYGSVLLVAIGSWLLARDAVSAGARRRICHTLDE